MPAGATWSTTTASPWVVARSRLSRNVSRAAAFVVDSVKTAHDREGAWDSKSGTTCVRPDRQWGLLVGSCSPVPRRQPSLRTGNSDRYQIQNVAARAVQREETLECILEERSCRLDAYAVGSPEQVEVLRD